MRAWKGGPESGRDGMGRGDTWGTVTGMPHNGGIRRAHAVLDDKVLRLDSNIRALPLCIRS